MSIPGPAASKRLAQGLTPTARWRKLAGGAPTPKRPARQWLLGLISQVNAVQLALSNSPALQAMWAPNWGYAARFCLLTAWLRATSWSLVGC